MSILFLSDIHLGSPLFDCENELTTLLTSIKFEKVFLVGDIVDTWENSIEDTIWKYEKLVRTLNSIEHLIVVRGNHDPDIPTLRKIFFNAHIVDFYEDNFFVVIHGHQYDIIYNNWYLLIRAFYPIVWLLERLGVRTISSMIDSYMYKEKDESYRNRIDKIEHRLINSHIDKQKYIVAGHTHSPKKIEGDNYTYLNCGDTLNNRTYIVFDDNDFIVETF